MEASSSTTASSNFSTSLKNLQIHPLHTRHSFSRLSLPARKLIHLQDHQCRYDLRVKCVGTTNYDEVVVDEEMEKIRRLQNESAVRGVALEGEKGRKLDLSPAATEDSKGLWRVGHQWLQEGGRW
ncbi:hypothetical protein QN277_013665 [Acacia crassicarpa]|uniref:Uncharacterized protein n=1 Tax=Acacia crassicarpa TaxID=499986 RepID=A0AAE1N332_9FABA|nr:hypothetical protein QN277_013665 [Acacia crassicarpa]